jgi:hypothetical protein
VVDGTDESDVIGHALEARLRHQIRLQAGCALVAAHDEQGEVALVQLGHGADEDIDALQLLQPSDPEQDGRVQRQAEPLAGR